MSTNQMYVHIFVGLISPSNFKQHRKQRPKCFFWPNFHNPIVLISSAQIFKLNYYYYFKIESNPTNNLFFSNNNQIFEKSNEVFF